VCDHNPNEALTLDYLEEIIMITTLEVLLSLIGRKQRHRKFYVEMRLLLLTLEKHKDGIWITRLIEELDRITVVEDALDVAVTVDVVTVERILHQVVLFDSSTTTTTTTEIPFQHHHDTFDDTVPSFLRQYNGIINRVSDAADPIAMKRCLTILTVAKYLLHLPVFNGPTAYSLCSNKWCHHVLFTMAKLHSPSTAIIDVPSLTTSNDTAVAADDTTTTGTFESILDVSQRLLPNDPLPHLLKPNAGGFGKGIIKIGNSDSDCGTVPTEIASNDDTLLLQAYHSHPTSSAAVPNMYRVWFLLGKVQCAVQRTAVSSNTTVQDNARYPTNNEFTSGCSANNVCQYRSSTKSSPTNTSAVDMVTPDASDASFISSSSSSSYSMSIQPWTVPDDVRIEIENQLLPLLNEDAHAGSVEFLQHPTVNEHSPYIPHRRYYFDLNLLSTLPIMDHPSGIVDTNMDSNHKNNTVWDLDYNPWSELAHGIISVMLKGST
jgi:glutathione synthase/RimK-type ligase-like ATP-grasp enzyme